MGGRSGTVVREQGTQTFAIVRLAREWQPEEARQFVTDLAVRRVPVEEPMINTLIDPMELVFRCSEYELSAIRRLLGDITPVRSRPSVKLVAAKNAALALNPSFRQDI